MPPYQRGLPYDTIQNSTLLTLHPSGSQPGETLPLENRATCEDIFGCHTEGFYWHLEGEVRDAAKHPTAHKMAPHSKEIFSPKCQWCQGCESLLHPHVHYFFHVICHDLAAPYVPTWSLSVSPTRMTAPQGLPYSLLCPQLLEQCLDHGRSLTNIFFLF